MTQLSTNKTPTVCQICMERCPIKVSVDDNRVVRVDGAQCLKGEHVDEAVRDPRRLSRPLKRAGERGAGQWIPISWDEALDTVAERFSALRREHGSSAIASVYGGNLDAKGIAARLFASLFGSRNLWTILVNCSMPTRAAHRATFGLSHFTQDGNPDYVNSRCILLWGSNNTHTRPVAAKAVLRAQAAGSRLIVVDPRPTEEALRADLWLRVRPGTDCALALGIARVLIDEDLYDREFVDAWCVGFGQLVAHLADYPVERVAAITGIAADDIVRAARLIAGNRPLACHMRHGVQSMQINSVQTTRAIGIVNVLINNVDVPGGNLLYHDLGGFNARGGELGRIFDELTGDERGWIGAKDYPLLCSSYNGGHPPTGVKAIADGDIKGLFIAGSNMMITEVDTVGLRRALTNLDCLVVTDIVMTPTAEQADIVLPAAHFLETEAVFTYATNPAKPRLIASQRALHPYGEARDDREIVFDLAARLGRKLPWRTVEEFNDWMLSPLGVDFDGILKARQHSLFFERSYESYRDTGFPTPSGKIELYSSLMEQHGYAPLPEHVESTENQVTAPHLAGKYPYTLINHKSLNFYHSTMRAAPSIRSNAQDPLIELHPDVAARHGIGEGDEMWIQTTPTRNPTGRKVFGRAKLVPELDPQIVSMEAGWWLPERDDDSGYLESNINAVLSNEGPYDPVGGTPQAKALLCMIGKTRHG